MVNNPSHKNLEKLKDHIESDESFAWGQTASLATSEVGWERCGALYIKYQLLSRQVMMD